MFDTTSTNQSHPKSGGRYHPEKTPRTYLGASTVPALLVWRRREVRTSVQHSSGSARNGQTWQTQPIHSRQRMSCTHDRGHNKHTIDSTRTCVSTCGARATANLKGGWYREPPPRVRGLRRACHAQLLHRQASTRQFQFFPLPSSKDR